MALEKNIDIQIKRLETGMYDDRIEQSRGEFDPVFKRLVFL